MNMVWTFKDVVPNWFSSTVNEAIFFYSRSDIRINFIHSNSTKLPTQWGAKSCINKGQNVTLIIRSTSDLEEIN